MPWCEPCSRYFAPSAVTSDGRCPSCDSAIEMPLRQGASDAPTLRDLSRMSGEKAPWHFKLLMAMLVLYLGWRLIAPFVD
ncbi:MAG: hypothetical protein RL552_449 [Actinomycetota bacterium]